MVAHAQLLFNDNSSALTLPTIDPRTSPQFPFQPILFQELASPVVLRLAASNLFESPKPEPDPVIGRLEADVVTSCRWVPIFVWSLSAERARVATVHWGLV